MRRRSLVLTLIVPIVASGCLGGPSHHASSTTTTAAPVSTAASRMRLTVFRVVGSSLAAQVVTVSQTRATAAASLGALGIDANVTIANGTATVDLANATAAQTAEIVYTLTQYPSVQRVDVGGKTGLTRADVAASLVPPISIEVPAAGASVSRTFHVSGTAMVFEATFVVELEQAGKVTEKHTVTASAGAPSRGTFDVTLAAQAAGPAEIVAYEPSAADGSPLHTVRVPVTIVG